MTKHKFAFIQDEIFKALKQTHDATGEKEANDDTSRGEWVDCFTLHFIVVHIST